MVGAGLSGAAHGALAVLLVALAGWAQAALHVVAPGQSLARALQMAADGDEIQLLAGVHRAQVGVIEQRRLTLRGVGGSVVLQADGAHAEGKAILVVRHGDVRIEGLEFRGARVPDRNGAGIRLEQGRLHVVRCRFFDNENGILTANFPATELIVQDSEFGLAPAQVALPHLLYVGRIARFTLTGSHFSGGANGHLVKSRARENHVRGNRLVDGAGGRAAYELEFPNGGLAFVVGNVLGQSADTSNHTVLAFGAEGSDGRPHALHVVNNTFINAARRPAVFVRVHEGKLGQAVEQSLVNNLFVGPGFTDDLRALAGQGNHAAGPHELVDVAGGAFGLVRNSPLRGRGVVPGRAHQVELQPDVEFTPPVGTRGLTPRAVWSPGAHQD
jgi:hypothetical protein